MAPLQQKRSVYEIVKHQFTKQLRKADKHIMEYPASGMENPPRSSLERGGFCFPMAQSSIRFRRMCPADYSTPARMRASWELPSRMMVFSSPVRLAFRASRARVNS